MLTAATTKVSSKRTKFLVLEITIGQMANHTQATGAKTKWMATVCSLGKTARNMKVTSLMIKEKAKVPSYGLMADNTSVNGKQGNNMVLALTSVKTEFLSKENGRMAARCAGWMLRVMTENTRRTDAK